ncbi:uncharacterized protein N7484_007108 [Penicillium longicatenatum]|uniref:uncharacterized protein n=1 Tax=Penicillium longicatenatum TaxID=1561947 RepID=UPI0025470705|nr:uncharacterized protein N7484_007108 [Penicillium longicatenatum]KAJ5639246.1 hypothetical protein N7484_007108 [Penicillium longicatenatum]
MNMAPPPPLPLALAAAPRRMPAGVAGLSNPEVTARLTHSKWKEYSNPLTWDQEILKNLITYDDKAANNIFSTLRPLPSLKEPKSVATVNLGLLGCLSLEVMHEIINHMDLLTIERFSRSCRFLRIAVNHHPSYRMVMEHASHIRDILSASGLAYWNSLGNFRNELQYPYCRSCGASGSYVFLPTCERICPNCCDLNKDYWCILVDDAKKAFAIDMPELRRIPIIRMKPNSYRPAVWPFALTYVEYMVPVKCAFEAGVKRWGTVENMQRQGELQSPDRNPDSTSFEIMDAELFRFFRSVLPRFGSDPLTVPFPRRPLYENFNPLFGAIAAWFPHVERLHVDPTPHYFCKGCVWAYERGILPSANQLSYMGLNFVLEKEDIGIALARRMRIPRTWPQTIIHSTNCPGCGLLMWDSKATEEEKRSV